MSPITINVEADSFCAATVALDHLISVTHGPVRDRMEKARKDFARAFENFCLYESGEVPALLRRQS